jgi:ribosomal protein S18 acetylase RimI-like enzyme
LFVRHYGQSMATDSLRIVKANATRSLLAVPIFDAYRQFYKKKSDLKGAREFLKRRLKDRESVLFVAFMAGGRNPKPVGLVHLYPTFSSLTLRRQWILSDLFVVPEARRKGVGEALMNRARKLAEETDADALLLETATDNFTAQRLYERLGYRRDEVFYRYALTI